MADKLQFDVKYSAGIITAEASGQLSFNTSQDLRRKLTAWLEPGVKGIIIDLREINHLDSAGIAAVLQAIKTCDAAEVSFHVRNPAAQLRTILTKSGLDVIAS